MPPITFEGTWEEIERHKGELIGHRLVITVLPAVADELVLKNGPSPKGTGKKLEGRGMFKGLLSTDEYLSEKRKDADREDRHFG